MALIMLDDASIKKKYIEIYYEYIEQLIDDYESFVKSRVAEYYLNTTHETIDDIFIRINEVLDELDEKGLEDISASYLK